MCVCADDPFHASRDHHHRNSLCVACQVSSDLDVLKQKKECLSDQLVEDYHNGYRE